MLTVMKANCTTNGLKVSDWSRKPVFDLAANIDQSLRGMIDGEESRKLSHSRFARSGFLFVILFELGAVIGLRFPQRCPPARSLPLRSSTFWPALSVCTSRGRFGSTIIGACWYLHSARWLLPALPTLVCILAGLNRFSCP